MIECPNCKHREFVGTLFCSECGTRLVLPTQVPTMGISRDKLSAEAKATKPSTPHGSQLSTGALLGLRVVTSGELLSLVGRDNYTLGRSIEGQAVIPDVDLNKYEAYDAGISRMHAELRIAEDGVYVVDLDSSNGTIVNGKRILAQEPEPINHGDILQLGRLRLQVIAQSRG
jgi:pSer/pThr/pTyr-binding forkhead associated (FHA) protein